MYNFKDKNLFLTQIKVKCEINITIRPIKSFLQSALTQCWINVVIVKHLWDLLWISEGHFNGILQYDLDMTQTSAAKPLLGLPLSSVNESFDCRVKRQKCQTFFTTYMGQEVILFFSNIGMLYRILPTLEGNNKGRKTKTKQTHCQYHLSSIIKLLCSWQTFYTTQTLKKLLHSTQGLTNFRLD